jgi:hypothetical protein
MLTIARSGRVAVWAAMCSMILSCSASVNFSLPDQSSIST